MKRMLMGAVAGLCLLGGPLGCVEHYNVSKLTQAASDVYNATTVDDASLKNMSAQMRAQEDAQAKVASAKNKYTVRLKRIMGNHTSVNGVPLNYKVYITKDINANASPDGSVRVYSGLMDMMNDDELRFVLGHEIGHVALGHSLNAMRMAYATSAARKVAGSFNTAGHVLSQSELGDLGEKFVNAQFSQSQESDADAYSMDFLKKNHYNTAAAASALRKLDSLGESGGFLSSHPNSAARAQKMEELAGK